MGDHANDLLNDCVDHQHDLIRYAQGELSHTEAYDLGLIDELGTMSNEDVALLPGVEDVASLSRELLLAELQFANLILRNNQQCKPKDRFWVSGGKIIPLKDMSCSHLTNAIAYSKRNDPTNKAIVKLLEKELECRNHA